MDKKLDLLVDYGEIIYCGSEWLKGCKVLVIGGDLGIGCVVVIVFVREGVDVVINYFFFEKVDGELILEILKEVGVSVKGIVGDIKEEDFCVFLVDEVKGFLDGLDIVVNNVGK